MTRKAIYLRCAFGSGSVIWNQYDKSVKTKIRWFWELIPTVAEVTVEKQWTFLVLSHPQKVWTTGVFFKTSTVWYGSILGGLVFCIFSSFFFSLARPQVLILLMIFIWESCCLFWLSAAPYMDCGFDLIQKPFSKIFPFYGAFNLSFDGIFGISIVRSDALRIYNIY